jgi:hypothetical protein
MNTCSLLFGTMRESPGCRVPMAVFARRAVGARRASGLRCRSLLVGVATQHRITGREAHDVLAALGKIDHQGFDVALFA